MRKRDKFIVILLLAFAVCCELYGIKVFLAGSGTAFFAIWLIIGLVFAAIAYAVKRSVWERLPRTARRVICILLCIGILSKTPMRQHWTRLTLWWMCWVSA